MHGPNSPLAEAGLHVSTLALQPRSCKEKNKCAQISLYCRDFGLKAEKCSVRPITEELEVLKELVAGLQDIKLIWEVRWEGGGGWSQPWCFNSQHL